MCRTACTEPRCLYSRAIPLLPLWAVRPVQSLSACTGCTFKCMCVCVCLCVCVFSVRSIINPCKETSTFYQPTPPSTHPLSFILVSHLSVCLSVLSLLSLVTFTLLPLSRTPQPCCMPTASKNNASELQ
jgi:hypothetical protein